MLTPALFELKGKIALVTGCNKGIGKAMAISLAEAGADIIGVSGSLAASGSEIELAVTALGRKFYPIIDILINNAGTIMRKPAAEHPDEYWDQVLALNLDAPFILAREFGKKMIERGSGKIIFTCSLLSFQGGINVPGYAASKGALSSLVKALSNEWASKGVQVNGIAPGYIATDNTEALRNDPERSKTILDRIPAGRWGQIEDFKGPTVFLASAASDYVSGTILTVDGGWMGR
jgi:2-dehydro-3-deoxy-D-gluconate 5-dehydrogenase